MAVCTFLGHQNVYDADIECRLQTAVNMVASENETVEFWLYPDETFFNYCLLAVLRVKKQNPQKIRICLVADESKYTKLMQQEPGSIPACMFDRIILCRTDDKKSNDFTMPYKTLLRYVVQNLHMLSLIFIKDYMGQRITSSALPRGIRRSGFYLWPARKPSGLLWKTPRK